MSRAAWLCAALVACLASTGLGWRLGLDHAKATQADLDKAVQQTREAAQQGAAQAIAKIEVKQQTIVQKVQHEVQTKEIYRDCVVPVDGVRLLNDAIAGRAQGDGSGGSGVRPQASAAQ